MLVFILIQFTVVCMSLYIHVYVYTCTLSVVGRMHMHLYISVDTNAYMHTSAFAWLMYADVVGLCLHWCVYVYVHFLAAAFVD